MLLRGPQLLRQMPFQRLLKSLNDLVKKHS